jgi:hypothetical protein
MFVANAVARFRDPATAAARERDSTVTRDSADVVQP